MLLTDQNRFELWKASVTTRMGCEGFTQLHIIAAYGLQLLINKEIFGGLNVNSCDEHNRTPLWFAASEGHPGAVKVLLSLPGISIDVQSDGYGTPLYAAADNEAVARLLIKHSADVNAQGGKYGSALQVKERVGFP